MVNRLAAIVEAQLLHAMIECSSGENSAVNPLSTYPARTSRNVVLSEGSGVTPDPGAEFAMSSRSVMGE